MKKPPNFASLNAFKNSSLELSQLFKTKNSLQFFTQSLSPLEAQTKPVPTHVSQGHFSRRHVRTNTHARKNHVHQDVHQLGSRLGLGSPRILSTSNVRADSFIIFKARLTMLYASENAITRRQCTGLNCNGSGSSSDGNNYGPGSASNPYGPIGSQRRE